MNQLNTNDVRSAVRANYAKVADSDKTGCGSLPASCCGTANESNVADASFALGYSSEEVSSVPEGANMGLGCGNPQAIASLKSGETVLDLGSGGGFDCFLAAQVVEERGYVIGVDMTPEMVEKARRNLHKSSLENIEFRLARLSGFDPLDNFFRVLSSQFPRRGEPEMGLNSL